VPRACLAAAEEQLSRRQARMQLTACSYSGWGLDTVQAETATCWVGGGLSYSVPALSWSSLTRSPQAFVPRGRVQGEGLPVVEDN